MAVNKIIACSDIHVPSLKGIDELKEILKNEEEKFLEGCKSNGYSEEISQKVYDLILNSVGDARDTLTEIMGRLSEYELFESKIDNPSTFLNNNYYLSLSGELDNTVRFTSVFLI